MKISIGTLSKAFDLSDEALRYYEKKGLLAPLREGESGYRVFERADIQRVSNVKRLQNQGFTLDEVRDIYSGIDEAALCDIYEKKLEETRRAIAYRTCILKHMREAAGTIQKAPELLNRARKLSLGKVYLLEYASIEELWQRVPREKALKEMLRHLPITSYTTIIPRHVLKGGECSTRKGVLFLEADAAILGADVSAFRQIDATKAVSCLFRLKNGGFDMEALLDILSKYLNRRGLEAGDDLFTVQLMSYVDEKGDAIHYSRMIVPVRQDG